MVSKGFLSITEVVDNGEVRLPGTDGKPGPVAGRKENLTPVVVVDSREQCPLEIRAFPTMTAGLPTGDYGIVGFSDPENPVFIVERKSLNDLAHSLGKGRARFLREIERMRTFRFRGLLIEGIPEQVALGHFHGAMNPVSILETLYALEVRTSLVVAWCGDPDGAARRLESWIKHFCRGVLKDYKRLATGNQQKI